jgi:sulfur carrier protein
MTEITMNKGITLNGTSQRLNVRTLAALLDAQDIGADGRGIAVAVNGAVVPRAAWSATNLRPGDSVEIVRARQGG